MSLSSLMFQDSWSPLMLFISSFHDHVMVVVCMIVTLVAYILLMIFIYPCINRFFFGNEWLELIWTVIPGFILGFLAVPSLHTLYLTDEVTKPLLSLKAMGHQWFWSYEYNDFEGLEFDSYMNPVSDLEMGSFRLLEVDNNTVIPVNVEVRLMVSSTDVIHSWTVPSLGIKVDGVPGRLNQLCIVSNHIGLSYGQCSEICGALHSFMPICLEIINLPSFYNWLSITS